MQNTFKLELSLIQIKNVKSYRIIYRFNSFRLLKQFYNFVNISANFPLSQMPTSNCK